MLSTRRLLALEPSPAPPPPHPPCLTRDLSAPASAPAVQRRPRVVSGGPVHAVRGPLCPKRGTQDPGRVGVRRQQPHCAAAVPGLDHQYPRWALLLPLALANPVGVDDSPGRAHELIVLPLSFVTAQVRTVTTRSSSARRWRCSASWLAHLPHVSRWRGRPPLWQLWCCRPGQRRRYPWS
jgi:hypothetical protein